MVSARLLALLGVVVALAGCFGLEQHRESSVPQAGDCGKGSPPSRCSFRLHERPGRSPYTLGVVEFDDQGLTYPVPQLGPFLEGLEHESSEYEGRIVLVFAHGWFHDARPGDDNLEFFSQMLEQFSAAETNAVAAHVQAKPRRVVGVYLAWRGAAWRTPGLEYLTFWSRKDTAHRIGEREATEVLLEIRRAAYRDAASSAPPNRFVVLGHSFGAALVYSAMSQLITNALLSSSGGGVQPLADAIVLFNAAFEAVRVQPLLAQALRDASDRPALTFLTAKNDRATGWMFPFARWINNVFGSFRDVDNPIKRGTVAERSANARTIGHFGPFLTHDMSLLTKEECTAPDPDNVRLKTSKASQVARADLHEQTEREVSQAQTEYRSEHPMTFGQTRLTPHHDLVSKRLSVFNVAVPKAIWNKHGFEQSGERRKYIMSFLMFYIPFAAAGPRLDLARSSLEATPRGAEAPARAPAAPSLAAPLPRF